MTSTPALRLIWSDKAGPLPDYAQHGQRPVSWAPWEPAAAMAHVPHGCDACSYDGRPWLSIGALQPLPGETTTVQEHRGHEPGRLYGTERRVPARPVSQLVAFRCPACHDLRVYDLGPDDCGWTEIYAVKAVDDSE